MVATRSRFSRRIDSTALEAALPDSGPTGADKTGAGIYDTGLRSVACLQPHSRLTGRSPPRPLERVFPISELAAGRFTVKPPFDRDPVTIHSAVPGARFPLECFQIGYASLAETSTGKQADFDLRLIQPASMRGRVVDCEAIPDQVARDLAVEVGQ